MYVCMYVYPYTCRDDRAQFPWVGTSSPGHSCAGGQDNYRPLTHTHTHTHAHTHTHTHTHADTPTYLHTPAPSIPWSFGAPWLTFFLPG